MIILVYGGKPSQENYTNLLSQLNAVFVHFLNVYIYACEGYI